MVDLAWVRVYVFNRIFAMSPPVVAHRGTPCVISIATRVAAPSCSHLYPLPCQPTNVSSSQIVFITWTDIYRALPLFGQVKKPEYISHMGQDSS